MECDSARFNKRKISQNGETLRVHNGRCLVTKSRKTKEWTASGLPPSISRGVKGMPTERTCEVEDLLHQQLGKATVLAPDGAAAWKKALDNQGQGKKKKPLLSGVSHVRGVYTPLSTVKKDDVDGPTREFLKRETHMAKDVGDSWLCVAGDNCAEGMLGCVKQCLRRMQGVGRRGGDKMRSVTALAAAYLHRHPGVLQVLQAHRQYRFALEVGVAGLSSRDAYQLEKVGWLWKE